MKRQTVQADFFLGALGPEGFRGYFEQLENEPDMQMYLIKSGPGCGKSTMMRHVAELARERGWRVVDVDCTIAAQAPKLAPYRDEMRANMAAALGVPADTVGVKATTTERLGFVGREEGIAAWAVALLERIE